MQIQKDRRALHQIPELDRQLPKTVEYLRSALSELGCRVFSPMEGALCAWFDFGRDTAIAFRADADALPILEKTGADYASTHPGKMHACGHDGHMAIVLERARRLSRKKTLPHNVLLVFQPAEETTGGAKDICDTGIFERHHVRAIFGLHLWPGLEAGVIASRSQELMSRSCELTVEVSGRSAHIAKPWDGVDALRAGVEGYNRIIALEKSLPEHIYRVLNFGKLESGTVRNAISSRTVLLGSLRAFQEDVFRGLQSQVLQIAADVEKESGCTVTVHMTEGYPAVMNPSDLYETVKTIVPFRELDKPSMTAEDFSWYQRRLPGLFFFLGTGETPALHADTFDFDEAILLKGADFFEKLAEEFP